MTHDELVIHMQEVHYRLPWWTDRATPTDLWHEHLEEHLLQREREESR